MNMWAWAWITWLVVTISMFLTLEITAIIRKNDKTKNPDTLSDHLVIWFNIRTRTGRIIWTTICVGLALLVAWLYPHILTGQAV